MKGFKDQFVDWVNAQDPNKTYRFMTLAAGERGCPATQFLHSLGLARHSGNRVWANIHDWFGHELCVNNTFGGLAKSIDRKLNPKTVWGRIKEMVLA